MPYDSRLTFLMCALFISLFPDSRAVICQGPRGRAITKDHKPGNKLEKERVEAAGGEVKTKEEVNYELQLMAQDPDKKRGWLWRNQYKLFRCDQTFCTEPSPFSLLFTPCRYSSCGSE